MGPQGQVTTVKTSTQRIPRDTNDLSVDHVLMKALIDGDESAFELLLTRYQKSIHHFAYRFLGDADTAKDVAQETFLHFYKALQNKQEIEYLSAFLFRIAKNCCIDIQRKQRLRSMAPNEFPVESQTAFHVLDEKERRLKIDTAVRLLPDNQRIAVLLRHTESASYQEIAKVMSTSVAAVESLLFRARSKLRQMVGQDEIPKP